MIKGDASQQTEMKQGDDINDMDNEAVIDSPSNALQTTSPSALALAPSTVNDDW